MKVYQIIFGTEVDEAGDFISAVGSKLRTLKSVAVGVFSGYTLLPVGGGWVNSHGDLVEEAGVMFIICANESNWDMIGQFAHDCRTEFDQNCVVLIEGGNAVLVEKDTLISVSGNGQVVATGR